ncbi:TM2 domain-containing protein [Actinocatenispora rupis]|uniref:TM2 domain-containing protein n=1 Tax=Actinocatenispora rupis TaxID=519421 RepID=UPI001EF36098|nr:TM2 domain-containing protein [Actinocatenispora rupis]
MDPVAPGDMTRDHQVPQSDAAAQQPAPQPVPPVQVVVSQNVSQQAVVAMGGVLRRSWVAALVLAILVGWLGVDSFYLGQTGKGVLKLFTFGLFGILWLIDTIMIATKSVRGVEWV